MAYIKAISYYLPEKIVTNEELVKEFPEWSVEKVAKKVGVNSRHLAGENETAGDMAEKAARKLFEEYNISPNEIDFLLLCTQSPDYFLPSTQVPAPIGQKQPFNLWGWGCSMSDIHRRFCKNREFLVGYRRIWCRQTYCRNRCLASQGENWCVYGRRGGTYKI